MRDPLKLRRYLVHFSSHNLPQIFTDTLVIGSGIAGITAASRATDSGSVLLVTKASLRDSNTNEAQGGIAGALNQEDSAEDHFQDTIKAGAELCDEDAV
ncbi:MAG: FAD-binding protein, partial [Planctomycetota bacterium]